MNVKQIFLAISTFLYSVSAFAQSYEIPRISPIPSEIAGINEVKINLDGIWKFNPVFKYEYVSNSSTENWDDIDVPGEWSMQGFKVDTGQAAAYFRTFSLPKDWKGNRVKIRFNGVYSKSIIYVNGKEAGSHHGGFTAFELDITDLISYKKENKLLLSVINESLADSLASGSRYACHPLGGISRSVTLFALPEVNISALSIQTIFDEDYSHAEIKPTVEIANESNQNIDKLKVEFDIRPVIVKEFKKMGMSGAPFGAVPAGETKSVKFAFPFSNPKKWDCENPNLYILTCRLIRDGEIIEIHEQKFGFRQVEVKGNQLFVNGKPVKLRGVNRHEVYPLTGRSVPKEMYRKDIEIFREGNVNHIRTCHYPPDEALMEAADELGMFIECEGPFCWSHETKGDSIATREIIRNQLLEMVVLYRNHPSIVFWSLSNESLWTTDYELAGKAVKELDPSRPLTFNYFPWGWVKNNQMDESVCAIASDHYPSPKGPGKYSEYNRPVNFGEFVHLNAYNRYELATDVALRDKWGIYLHDMWEDMYKSQGVVGGSIWAGIDDTFYWDYTLEDGSIEERTVGYGTWGPIDGWRRKKPEWWGMKKTYSPIRISNFERRGERIYLTVENRMDFSNISRLDITWKIGSETGSFFYPDIKARQSGEISFDPKLEHGSDEKLEILFYDKRGFVVDSFSFSIDSEIIKYDVPLLKKNTIKFTEDERFITIVSNLEEYNISKHTGLITSDKFTGPQLMILPMNNGGDTQMHGPTKYYEPYNPRCTDWKLKKIETAMVDGIRVVSVHGKYKEAEGSFLYRFNAGGDITIEYDFELNEDVNPRQIGLVFNLPAEYENLYWKRKGYWSTYPDWHIARLEGKANASEGYEATPVGPRTKPSHEWRHDRTAIGSNDFASTKHNIYKTSLSNASGNGIVVRSAAKLHSRTWIEEGKINWLIANYSNGGSERFLRPHADKDDVYLKVGDTVKGSVKLMINVEL